MILGKLFYFSNKMSSNPNPMNWWWGECLSRLSGLGLSPGEISVFWREGRGIGLRDQDLCEFTVESARKSVSERFRAPMSRSRSWIVRRTPSPRYQPYPVPVPARAPVRAQTEDPTMDYLTERFGDLSPDDLESLIGRLRDL